MASTTEQIYTEIGKLVFQTGLPQLFGLFPEDDLQQHPNAQEAMAIMLGMFSTISEGRQFEGKQFDGYDVLEWKQQGLKKIQSAC
jgi:hypothetical protein